MSDLRFDRQYKQIWTTYFKKYKKIYTQNKPKEFEMLREDLKVGLKGLVTSEREGCNMVDEFIKYLPEIRSQEHEWVKLGDNFLTILLAIVSNFVGFYNGMYTVLYNTQLNIAEKGFDIAGIDAYKDLVINNWKMWGQNILTITNEVAIFLVMAMIIILIIHFYQWRRNREFALLKGYNCLIKDVVYELKEELKNEIQNNQ